MLEMKKAYLLKKVDSRGGDVLNLILQHQLCSWYTSIQMIMSIQLILPLHLFSHPFRAFSPSFRSSGARN